MKNKMKKQIIIAISFLLIGLPFCYMGGKVQAKGKTQSVVMKRLQAVRKDFPDRSRINSYITVNEFSGGGCNALVMYATLKIFHNAYVPGSDTYRRVGKTTSTKSNRAMRKLFKKAKVGDVVRWRKDYANSHFAIFLSENSKGIYLYEANFGSRNKVWYKHFWAWDKMKSWPKGGANKVNVYRSKNYNKVNKKKSAINYKKGDEIVIQGLCYRIKKTNAIDGVAKWIGYESGSEGKKIPKYLCVNRDIGDELNSNEDSYGASSKKRGRNAQIVYRVEK